MKGRIFGRDRKMVILGLIIIGVFVGMILFAKSIHALGSDDDLQMENNEYYHQLEKVFTGQLAETLRADGFPNCGITLNCIIEPGISRQYKVYLHHERLSRMDTVQQQEYFVQLEQVEFPEENCKIEYVVLE
ncbi:MAG: hypothetical protein ACI4DU_01940 [Lachnospiraceae bacterium]